MLDREEYVEQAYFFRSLGERLRESMATQDLLRWIKEEILATTRLPMAMDFMSSELKLHGKFSPAMAKLAHYFTPFQTYVVAEAENAGKELRRSLYNGSRGAGTQTIYDTIRPVRSAKRPTT